MWLSPAWLASHPVDASQESLAGPLTPPVRQTFLSANNGRPRRPAHRRSISRSSRAAPEPSRQPKRKTGNGGLACPPHRDRPGVGISRPARRGQRALKGKKPHERRPASSIAPAGPGDAGSLCGGADTPVCRQQTRVLPVTKTVPGAAGAVAGDAEAQAFVAPTPHDDAKWVNASTAAGSKWCGTEGRAHLGGPSQAGRAASSW